MLPTHQPTDQPNQPTKQPTKKYQQDLLEYVFSKDQTVMDEPVEAIMQPTYFVPETMTIWTCFQVRCLLLPCVSRSIIEKTASVLCFVVWVCVRTPLL